ncbi:MAG: HDOD domain-containing protein [Opitutaceae bacterium]
MSIVSISAEAVLHTANTLRPGLHDLVQLSRLLQSSSVDLDEVTSRMKRDPALTARLIRIANSAAFAEVEPVASVEDAVALIGFREVHRIVGFAMLEHFGDENLEVYGISAQKFRDNSLFCAILMEELAVNANVDPRSSYTVGLLRSIGKVCLDKLGRDYKGIYLPRLSDDVGLEDWENAVFGMTSNKVAGTVLSTWRFPGDFISAIKNHYKPDPQHEALTHLLSLAASMADILGYGLEGEGRYWLEPEEVYHKAGLDPRQANLIIDHAFESFNRLLLTIGAHVPA